MLISSSDVSPLSSLAPDRTNGLLKNLSRKAVKILIGALSRSCFLSVILAGSATETASSFTAPSTDRLSNEGEALRANGFSSGEVGTDVGDEIKFGLSEMEQNSEDSHELVDVAGQVIMDEEEKDDDGEEE